eukprot:CAMPEP_0170523872 /NCGR_PEP_ID=MMETSP0209-20121228/9308_1 /TAXON_ID=665100 ORGANISM="Litonotus pictus, Strain P1" /NCGR_SAMPLE_ID=MMETSP0209 /ASSEMBLY_ACC=CAM_ASM_000301 /LENGTH=130 /DNA_ID=CAMNT_0010812217 /DNA_START=4 /DNA_END=393 /DNA_ORIENTATION=+
MTHPVYITHNMLHGHFLLRKIVAEVKRTDNTTDRSMIREKFDLSKHSFTPNTPYLKLNPGDEINTECYFNSLDYDHTVSGGYKASDEMCLTYLGYYPRNEGSMYFCLHDKVVKDAKVTYSGSCKKHPRGV